MTSSPAIVRPVDYFPQLSRLTPAAFGSASAAILIAYLLLVFTGVVSHEPWFDEAQSWLLARDASMGELLGTYLRYEGHPPLWYAVLALPAKLGLPYKTANVLSAGCMSLGVLLFLRLPAVPWVIRCLVPFGFFIAYQYSVVARSYALMFPILMALAHLYPRRRQHVVAVAALLVALSNVSLHGLAMAWAFAALYALELWASGQPLGDHERRSHLAALALLVLATALLLIVLWPPGDLLIAGEIGLENGVLLLGRVFKRSILGLFSAWPALSLGMLGVYLWWFYRQKLLATFLAPAGAVYAITGIYSNRWHEGLFFLLWLFVLLLSLRAPSPATWRRGIVGLSVVVLGQHVVWAGRTLHNDWVTSYSASQEAADFVEANNFHQARLYGLGFSVLALQPYFDQPLFDNYRPAGGFTFWDWSADAPLFHPGSDRTFGQMREWAEQQIDERPDIILVGLKFPTDTFYLDWLNEHQEYRFLRSFTGGLYWKDDVVENDGYAIYMRSP